MNKRPLVQTKLNFMPMAKKTQNVVAMEEDSGTENDCLATTAVAGNALAQSCENITATESSIIDLASTEISSVVVPRMDVAPPLMLAPSPMVVASHEDEEATVHLRHWITSPILVNTPHSLALPCKNEPHWRRIQTALQDSSTFESTVTLLTAMQTYRSDAVQSFGGLATYLMEYPLRFGLIPRLAQLALRLPELFPANRIPCLRRTHDVALTMHNLQAACLLANAFFCTYELPSDQEVYDVQDFNFAPMYNGGNRHVRQGVLHQKLNCLFHYFERILEIEPQGFITFHRRSMFEHQMPSWEHSDAKFTGPLEVFPAGTIEDDSPGFLQLDFANKFIGGGVLRYGAVQEEILMMICPTLLCSLLFTERMEDLECVFIKGAERYSTYTGYASSFMFGGDYRDDLPRDSEERLEREILALDALAFPRGGPSQLAKQYHPRKLKRELHKAYLGFLPSEHTSLTDPKGIATGNWGCGAFNGDVQLKAVIQLMAAAVVGRPIRYFTFNDERFTPEDCDPLELLKHPLATLFDILREKRVTVQELYQCLMGYRFEVLENDGEDAEYVDLFTFVKYRFDQ